VRFTSKATTDGLHGTSRRAKSRSSTGGAVMATLTVTICPVVGGRGRTRTGTPVTQKQILSLLCLPFHHAACVAF
jgi:hypothetical protein